MSDQGRVEFCHLKDSKHNRTIIQKESNESKKIMDILFLATETPCNQGDRMYGLQLETPLTNTRLQGSNAHDVHRFHVFLKYYYYYDIQSMYGSLSNCLYGLNMEIAAENAHLMDNLSAIVFIVLLAWGHIQNAPIT